MRQQRLSRSIVVLRVTSNDKYGDIIGFFRRKEDGKISLLVPGSEEITQDDESKLVNMTVDYLYNSKEFFNVVSTIVDIYLEEKLKRVNKNEQNYDKKL